MTARRGLNANDVVVITGASSGIGRATAHAFANRGARLVLAARSATTLDEVAGECFRDYAGQALVVQSDVTDEAQVEALARAAMDAFGRIDVWVGNASVFGYGTFLQTPAAVFRRVIETNLFGQVYGARAALRQFSVQGSGTLILVASLYGKITSPYLSPYITSKFALRGFAEVLREEMSRYDGIEVCTVLPATIDTPIYDQAANYTGVQTHPLPPVVKPERVAAAIVGAVDRPRREITVGQLQRAAVLMHAVAPRLYERLVVPVFEHVVLRGERVEHTEGNLFGPQPEANRLTGGWQLRRVRRRRGRTPRAAATPPGGPPHEGGGAGPRTAAPG